MSRGFKCVMVSNDTEACIQCVCDVIQQSGFVVTAQTDMEANGRPCHVLTVYPVEMGVDYSVVDGRFATLFPANVVVREIREGCFEVVAADPVARVQTEIAPELLAIFDRLQTGLRCAIEAL